MRNRIAIYPRIFNCHSSSDFPNAFPSPVILSPSAVNGGEFGFRESGPFSPAFLVKFFYYSQSWLKHDDIAILLDHNPIFLFIALKRVL